MSQIYEPDLDLFAERQTQISHASTKFTPINTLSNLQNIESTIVEFDVPATDNYIDLKKTELELKVKIQKNTDGVLSDFKIAEDGSCLPCNYFLHGLIERVEILLGPGREPISPTDSLYGLCAYLEALLNYGSDAQKSWMTKALYLKDVRAATVAENTGGVARGKLFENGQEVVLRGPLHTNIWKQPKPLISNCGFRLKIHLKNPNYCMQAILPAGKTHSFVYKITNAVLHACYVRPTASVALAHEKTLASATAKYPIRHAQVTHHTIAQGSSNFSYQNLFASQVPDQLFITLHDSDSFEGTQTKDCFYFENAKMASLKLSLDGQPYPVEEMKFNFEKNDFLDGYNSIFTATGCFSQDIGLDLSQEEYKKGFTVFCFDLTRSGQGINNSIQDVKKTGDLSLDVHFHAPLGKTQVLVVIGYFKRQIEITKTREIIKDFR